MSTFVSQWNTTYTGDTSTASNQIKLPLYSAGTYNFTVFWGDGNSDLITAWDSSATTHTYSSGGTYTVTISGDCTIIKFNNGGDKLKLVDISAWDNLLLEDCEYMFRGCTNFNDTSTSGDNPNTSGVTNFRGAFQNCTNYNGRITYWDFSNATEMGSMFSNCTNFNQFVGYLDVSNVTNMSSMFANCVNFNQLLVFWDVSSVQTMSFMFYNCANFNQSHLVDWDVSNVTNFWGMFNGATSFNQDIGDWDVSNVTNFSWMFSGATSFNQDLSGWCVKNNYNNPSAPDEFDDGATSWVLSRPVWGNCPCQEDIPTGITLTNIDCNSMYIGWVNNSTDLTGNTIQRYTGSTWYDFQYETSGATGTTLSGLTSGTQYVLRVVAEGDGFYGNSDSVTGTTETGSIWAAASGSSTFVYTPVCPCNVGEIEFYSYSGTCVTESYEFSVSGDTAYQTGTTFTGLTVGSYDCWVRDAGNPTLKYNLGNVSITALPKLGGYILYTGQTCYGVPDGIIQFYPSGGTGEYQYNVTNGDGDWYDDSLFTGLTEGNQYGTSYIRDKNFPCCWHPAHNGPAIRKQYLSAGVICCNQQIGAGDTPYQLYQVSPASGVTSAIKDNWQYRIYYETEWTDLDSGYTTTYNPPQTIHSTYYRKIIVDNNGDGICTGYSNTILISVTYPPPFCDFDTPYTVSAATCSSMDGNVIVDMGEFLPYSNYYDFYLGDSFGTSYPMYTDRFYVTAGWYALVALPKQEYWSIYGRDGCAYTWIQVNNSDTTMSLVNKSVRDASCGTFGADSGRIVYFCTDSGGVGDYDIYLFNESGDIVRQVNQDSIEQIIFSGLPADNYYLMILNNDGANGGCRLLVGLTEIKSLNNISVAGIKKLWLTEWTNEIEYNYWTAADEDYYVSGLDSDFFTSIKIKEFVDETLTSPWYSVNVNTKGISFQQTMNKTKQGFVFMDKLTLTIPEADNQKWKELQDLLVKRYVLIFLDNNGNYWCSGYRLGAKLNAFRRENNEYILEFEAMSDTKLLTNIDKQYVINSIL